MRALAVVACLLVPLSGCSWVLWEDGSYRVVWEDQEGRQHELTGCLVELDGEPYSCSVRAEASEALRVIGARLDRLVALVDSWPSELRIGDQLQAMAAELAELREEVNR